MILWVAAELHPVQWGAWMEVLWPWYFGERLCSKRQASAAVEHWDCAHDCSFYWRQCEHRSAEPRDTAGHTALPQTDSEGEATSRSWSALLNEIIEEFINKEAIVACFRQEYAAIEASMIDDANRASSGSAAAPAGLLDILLEMLAWRPVDNTTVDILLIILRLITIQAIYV